MISLSDKIALASLAASFITAVGATYLSYVALKMSAKPRFTVVMNGLSPLVVGQEYLLRFTIKNLGHWFVTPAATDITVYANFDPAFRLVKLNYGSIQEIENRDVRVGKKGFSYIKARHVKLLSKKEAEDFTVTVFAPEMPGTYVIDIEAISQEGATASAVYHLDVRPQANPPLPPKMVAKL